jgi:hypothetical protein
MDCARSGRSILISILASLPLFIGCTTVDVSIEHVPTAFAGYDRSARVGDHVPLDGTLSMSPNGSSLTYAWRIESSPPGSRTSIPSPTSVLTEIVPDELGTYVVSLMVSDGVLEARDLVGVDVTRTASSTFQLSLELEPRACNADFDHLSTADCGDAEGGVSLAPTMVATPTGAAARIEWSLLRLPTGVDAADVPIAPLDDRDPLSAVHFAPPRPGQYWVSARLLVDTEISAPALASVGVYAGPVTISSRPLARIDATKRAMVHDRVLLDSRSSSIPTSTAAITRSWGLIVDPSGGIDQLTSVDMVCPDDSCRFLFPSRSGVYVVTLQIKSGDIEGAAALHAIEVK